jgi:hypothetical protein
MLNIRNSKSAKRSTAVVKNWKANIEHAFYKIALTSLVTDLAQPIEMCRQVSGRLPSRFPAPAGDRTHTLRNILVRQDHISARRVRYVYSDPSFT